MAARTRALLGVDEPRRPGRRHVSRHGWRPGAPPDDARQPADGDPADGEPGPGESDAAPRHRPRWQPDRRTLLSLVAVVVVVAAATGWWVLRSRPGSAAVRAVPGPATVSASAGLGTPLGATASPRSGAPRSGASSTAPVAPAVDLVVDVAGQVAHPGVYRLPAGARVIDALIAAGGALPGVSTASLNLAAPLRDGQQVALGVPGAPDADPVDAGTSGTAGGGLVNLNTAGGDQLQALPGVGPVLAQHILDWRAEHGRFSSVDQLNEVSGIGPAKFAALRAHVTV